jgi:hypothetical protein
MSKPRFIYSKEDPACLNGLGLVFFSALHHIFVVLQPVVQVALVPQLITNRISNIFVISPQGQVEVPEETVSPCEAVGPGPPVESLKGPAEILEADISQVDELALEATQHKGKVKHGFLEAILAVNT